MRGVTLACVCFVYFPQCNVRAGVCVAEGMRLRGRDLEDSAGSWIPSVLGVQSVRLRLRLDRRTDKGRGLWQLVDLNEEAVPGGQDLWDRTPPTCSPSKNRVIASFLQFLHFFPPFFAVDSNLFILPPPLPPFALNALKFIHFTLKISVSRSVSHCIALVILSLLFDRGEK